jgi:hypothetical protein
MRVRFDRVMSSADSLTSQVAVRKQIKNSTVGIYADSALACCDASQSFAVHLRHEG